jgi:4-amino-4-deoxy-L-arabinose transferase-like glycosyltransferase
MEEGGAKAGDSQDRETQAATRLEDLLLRHPARWVALLAFIVFVPWLGLRDLWYAVEPDLAGVCLAMIQSGDWVVPRFNGEVFLDYPPFLYWVAAASSWLLGGLGELSMRLPGALVAFGMVGALVATGTRWFDARTGLWAGLVVLGSSQFAKQSVSYGTDVWFTTSVAMALLVYGSAGEPARWTPRVVAFLLLGIAWLVKGPLGLLLPGLVLVLWHAARREWRSILELAPLTCVALLMALPWYFAVADAVGGDYVIDELLRQNIQRFGSGEQSHGQPLFYYTERIWIDLAPWIWLLPVAVAWGVRVRAWRDRHVQLALWWFGTFFVFLSAAATKRQAYLAPAFPALALLLGVWLSAVLGGRERADPRPVRWFVWAAVVALSVLGLGFALAAAGMPFVVPRIAMKEGLPEVLLGMRGPLLALGAVALISALWAWRAFRRGDLGSAFATLGVGQIAAFGVVVALGFPVWNPLSSYAPAAWLRGRTGDQAQLGYVGRGAKVGAFAYYAEAKVVELEDTDEIAAFFQEHPSSLVVVETKERSKLRDADGAPWQPRVVREFTAARRHYLVAAAPDSSRDEGPE